MGLSKYGTTLRRFVRIACKMARGLIRMKPRRRQAYSLRYCRIWVAEAGEVGAGNEGLIEHHQRSWKGE